jgi:ABC-type lipoprotein release transport system permease subunit
LTATGARVRFSLDSDRNNQVRLLVIYAAFTLGVCLLACVVPTRRALRVQPIVPMRVIRPK